MNARLIATHLSLLMVLILGAPAFAQDPDLVPHAQPACGKWNVHFQVKTDNTHPKPQVDPSKALIYVVEVSDATVRVGLDGKWAGATRGRLYLWLAVDPGEHHLCVDALSDVVELGRPVSLYGFTAEAGKTYYFRARATLSFSSRWHPDLDLDLVNDDEGKLLVANASLSISHPKK
jgi:hypothetical protein